ncbi:MAG TPA: outer membrane beta-barrel protein [Kofleriaceae bacterium]
MPVTSAPALAAPVTAGVALGVANSATNADQEGDEDTSLGLFGRLDFTARLAGQLELQKMTIDDDYTGNAIGDIRSVTALLVVELYARSRFHFILMAGAGIDHASTDYDETNAHHFEGGLGVEYRAEGGFVIGADFRIGGRSVDDEEEVYYDDIPALIYAPGIDEGEYRAARIFAGVRF